MKTKYKWDALKSSGWFVDYQNYYTFLGVMGQRQLYLTVANALIDAGEDEKAIEMMDLCEENFPESNFPLESISIGFSGNDWMVAQMIENYYYLGAQDKAHDMAVRMTDALMEAASFYIKWGGLGASEFETAGRVYLYIADVCKQYGDKDLSDTLNASFDALLKSAQ
jgi:hypothetical protein